MRMCRPGRRDRNTTLLCKVKQERYLIQTRNVIKVIFFSAFCIQQARCCVPLVFTPQWSRVQGQMEAQESTCKTSVDHLLFGTRSLPYPAGKEDKLHVTLIASLIPRMQRLNFR